MYNNKGQAGSVFKLLIGAVVGVGIIGIIISIIMIVDDQKTYLVSQAFQSKIEMAIKNPTGQEYYINDYSFEKSNVLVPLALAEKTGLNASSIELKIDEKLSSNSSIKLENGMIYFLKKIIVDIGVICTLKDNTVSCTITIYDRGCEKCKG